MDICLSHITALEFWRSLARRTFLGVLRAARPGLPVDGWRAPSKAAVDFICERNPQAYALPLHVFVANAESRTGRGDVCCHVMPKGLPEGALVRVGKGLCVCSPEFCFVQMATRKTLAGLIELGYELCGLYRLSRTGPARCDDLVPLTSVEKLKAFLETCEGMPGVKKARRALRHVMPNSASPMETILVMMLCLPFSLGGYALPVPRQNYRIDFPKGVSGLCSKSYYVCDLYWPDAKLAIEYDSDLEHTGSANITRDASKRNELLHLGIVVITVTRLHLKDPAHVHRIARLVAKRLGKRCRDAERGRPDVRRELRRELLDFSKLA